MSYVDETEAVGHMTFGPMNIDLSQLPNNDEATEEAIATVQWVRLATILLRCDDKEMEEKAREVPETFLELMEDIAPTIKNMKARLGFLEQASARMMVVMDRIIRDNERPMQRPAENVVTMGGRSHV